MKHKKTEMKYLGRHPHKHTYHNLRRANIWYFEFECPVCKCMIFPACNPNWGKKFYCDGTKRHKKSDFTIK